MTIRQTTEQERVRIAQDLHDDLGARLTEISLLGSLGVRPATTLDKAQGYLSEIVTQSREMVAALDEIVWAVNPKNDALTSVISYFCHYAQRFLEATPILCRLDVAKELPSAPFDSEQRHGLFLAFKEALNNAVLHSSATELWLRVSVREDTLRMLIEDNGHGLADKSVVEGADGLMNMRDRLSRLGGTCDVRSAVGVGTVITFTLPLARRHRGLKQ
jgi:signal transduction histidine kinase